MSGQGTTLIMDDNKIQRSSLQSEVVTRLRDEIVQGVWKPGTRLQERLLCDRYGISRSPLREAYQVLSSEGLLDITLNRGAVVSAPTPALTLQQFVLFQALEVLAIELACDNATDEALSAIRRANQKMKTSAERGAVAEFLRDNTTVHRLVVEASGNAPLIEAHTVVSRQLIRVQNLDGPLEHPISESESEHDNFIDALAARDKVRAAAELRRHLATVEDNLRKRLLPFA